MPGGNKKVTHFQLQVCLRLCDLFVTNRHYRLKYFILDYFQQKLHNFPKTLKNSILCPFRANFDHFTKNTHFLKKLGCHF